MEMTRDQQFGCINVSAAPPVRKSASAQPDGFSDAVADRVELIECTVQ
jgi:hypothetical protein